MTTRTSHAPDETAESPLASEEARVDRAIEEAVVRAVLGGNDASRRAFIRRMGAATFYSALASVFPLAACKSAAKEELDKTAKGATAASTSKPLEKKDLKVGFVPITCATPIIMAHPLGFYEKYGLKVDVMWDPLESTCRHASLSIL